MFFLPLNHPCQNTMEHKELTLVSDLAWSFLHNWIPNARGIAADASHYLYKNENNYEEQLTANSKLYYQML